jgi:hypothetical protein
MSRRASAARNWHLTWDTLVVRRLAPWILIGTLALASALGAELGLAEAPVTTPASLANFGGLSSPSPAAKRSAASPATVGTTSTTTSTTIGFGPCVARILQLTTSVVNTAAPENVDEGALTLTNVSSGTCELSTAPVFEVTGTNHTVLAATGPGKVVDDLIRPGQAQGANLAWQNWCGADLGPLMLMVILPNGGGTLSSPYGDASTILPACADRSRPDQLVATGSAGSGTLFGR